MKKFQAILALCGLSALAIVVIAASNAQNPVSFPTLNIGLVFSNSATCADANAAVHVSADFCKRQLRAADGSVVADWSNPNAFVAVSDLAAAGSIFNNGFSILGDSDTQNTFAIGNFARTNGYPFVSPNIPGQGPVGTTRGWTLIDNHGVISGSNDFVGGANYYFGGVTNLVTGALVQSNMTSFVNADQNNATITFANLTVNNPAILIANKKYRFTLVLLCADSTAADGAKVDFNGGTATATNFRVHGQMTSDTGTIVTLAAAASTTLAGVINAAATATVNQHEFIFQGSFEPSGAGTFIPRIAQNAHSTGTLTVFRGSNLIVTECP